MKPLILFLVAANFVCGAEVAYVKPMGGMTVVVPAGQTRSVSLPLLHAAVGTGAVFGRVAVVGTNYIDVTGAGWSPGGYSNVANPYFLRMRTGAAAGRLFLVTTTANTDSRLFVNNDGADLALSGVASNDVYELVLADTLLTFFGTNTLQGGTSFATADNVQVWGGASWLTFYYNTTNARWQRDTDTGASPTRNTFVLRPDRGIMISRKGATELRFYLTGRVPELAPKHWHLRPGVTFLSSGVPADQTLANLGLQTRASGWQGSPSYSTAVSNADLIQVWGGASWLIFYYDTTNNRWQREGDATQVSRNTFVVPAGRPVMVRRLTAAGGPPDSIILLPIPYTLQ